MSSMLLPSNDDVVQADDAFGFDCGGFGGLQLRDGGSGSFVAKSNNDLLDESRFRLTVTEPWTPRLPPTSTRPVTVKSEHFVTETAQAAADKTSSVAPELLLHVSEQEGEEVLFRSCGNRIRKYRLHFDEDRGLLVACEPLADAFVDSSVFQLEWMPERRRLMVRSRFRTVLLSFETGERRRRYADAGAVEVFDRSMKLTALNSLIPEEILGVSAKDLVTWGRIDEGGTRFMTANSGGGMKIVDVKWSLDHPRLVYLATTDGLLLCDLRTERDAINLRPSGDGDNKSTGKCVDQSVGGFRGSFTAGGSKSILDSGHLAMTYAALGCLLILGDDLSRVDYGGVLDSLLACRLPDGSFASHPGGSENDMRFIYCAASVSKMIGQEKTVITQQTLRFIRNSFNYDGGFGQGPKLESHGGSTFCALATLYLADRLMTTPEGSEAVLTPEQLDRCRRWCLTKQQLGFHGRSNKPDDSCYAFWIGASLKLLDSLECVDTEGLREFVLACQSEITGGFCKYPDSRPTMSFAGGGEEVDVWLTGTADPLHTYCSLAGLSLVGEPRLAPIHPAFNLTRRVVRALETTAIGRAARQQTKTLPDSDAVSRGRGRRGGGGRAADGHGRPAAHLLQSGRTESRRRAPSGAHPPRLQPHAARRARTRDDGDWTCCEAADEEAA